MIVKIKQLFHFVSQSHRGLHIVCGLLVGLVFGFGAVICVAGALELKDCQHDGLNVRHGVKLKRWIWRAWDWTDFFCTVAGGLIGSVLRWWVIGRFM